MPNYTDEVLVHVLEETQFVASVTEPSHVVSVGAQGPRGAQGPPGPPGPSGDGAYPAVTFSFNSPSQAIYTLPAIVPSEVMLVSLSIEEAFDGTGAAILLGTLSDPDALFTASDSYPGLEATFEVTPRVELPPGTQIYLTVVPGAGASTGIGQIVLQATPSA